jgi:hypothetical protein
MRYDLLDSVNFPRSFCVLAACIIFSQPASSSEIVAATSSRTADPASAYDSEHQEFVGQACLQKKYHPTGNEKASGQLQLLNSETATDDQLGFSAGGHARFGVVSASAEARFSREARSNAFSVSATWVSEYKLLSYKVDSDSGLNQIGKDVQNDPTRWKKTCGDEYVDEIVRGARLFFSIRIDFASKDIKQDFSAKFSIAGPMASAQGTMQQASQQFSRDSKVIVSALQVGGDAAKFTGLFPQTVDGRASFVSCTLGEFSKCQEVIQAALKYATDIKDGFPSQLSDKANPSYLVYLTAPYSALGIFPKYSPELTELAEKYRSDIHDKFEKELQTASLIDSLLAVDSTPELKQRVSGEQQKNKRNLIALVNAGNICYDEIAKCAQAHDALVLEQLDANALELPPPPTASFRYMSSLGEVSSKENSIILMSGGDDPVLSAWLKDNSEKILAVPAGYASTMGFVNGKGFEIYHIASLNLPIKQSGEAEQQWDRICSHQSGQACKFSSYYKDQIRLEAHSNASVVLYIEGTKLRDATLYFQGKQLARVVLNTESRRGDHRYSEAAAAIVVATNRMNDDWWDVNIDKETVEMSKSRKAGDGIFYVTVRDGFGRERRFDLAYRAWFVVTRNILENQSDPKEVKIFVHKRDRWWAQDFSGTKLSGDGGAWSTDAWASAFNANIVGDPPDFPGWQ